MQLTKLRAAPILQPEVPPCARRPREPRTASQLIASVADDFDPWSVVLAFGCILASIGLGMTGFKPWEKIQETSQGPPFKTQ